MKIYINTNKVYKNYPIWEVDLTDFDYSTLDNLEWKSMNTNLYESERRSMIRLPENYKINNHLFKELDNLFSEPSNLQKLYQNYPYDKEKYKSPSDYLKTYLTIGFTLIRDNTTFSLESHVDNRFVFGNILINLNDNIDSTFFYKNHQDREVIYKAPKKKGKGVFFLNSEETFHSIKVTQTDTRYMMFAQFFLNLF